MSGRGDVTAIVVVRNGEAFLGSALASIRGQSRPPAEILVLDGGSTDRTAAIAAATPGVRLSRQAGRGLARARNQAIAEARGEIVAFLDHDDLWTPDKLALQLPLLAALPPPAGCIGRLRLFGASPQAIRPGRTPGTLIAHRALFDRVGWFDESLAVGCDMDWFQRAALAGVPMAETAETVLLKRRHGGNLSADPARNLREAFLVVARSLAVRRAGPPESPEHSSGD